MQQFDQEQLRDGIAAIDKITDETLLLCHQAEQGGEIETEYLLKALPKLSYLKVLLENALSDLIGD